MIVGAGGYKTSDLFRVGGPLTIIYLAVVIVVTDLLY
jgi:di/tricarboxylate transporter